MTATPAAPRPDVLSVLTSHPDESRAGALGSTPGVSHPPHLAAPKGASPEAPASLFDDYIARRAALDGHYSRLVGRVLGINAGMEAVGATLPAQDDWDRIVAAAEEASEELARLIRVAAREEVARG